MQILIGLSVDADRTSSFRPLLTDCQPLVLALVLGAWLVYNDTVLRFFNNPVTMGPLEFADAVGQAGAPGQGPYMVIRLKMADERIGAARFETYGCPSAIACGSWFTQWCVGRFPREVFRVEPNDISLVLGGLPLGKEHCSQLAVTAMRKALDALGAAA